MKVYLWICGYKMECIESEKHCLSLEEITALAIKQHKGIVIDESDYDDIINGSLDEDMTADEVKKVESDMEEEYYYCDLSDSQLITAEELEENAYSHRVYLLI